MICPPMFKVFYCFDGAKIALTENLRRNNCYRGKKSRNPSLRPSCGFNHFFERLLLELLSRAPCLTDAVAKGTIAHVLHFFNFKV